jgi:hypothetical protein
MVLVHVRAHALLQVQSNGTAGNGSAAAAGSRNGNSGVGVR